MNNKPTGTVTFLFTDVQGGTALPTLRPAQGSNAPTQQVVVRDAIEAEGGYAYKVTGAAFQAAFPSAPQAVRAALRAQRALQGEQWPEPAAGLTVRMALHTGITEERGDDYVGPLLNRVARLLSAGHGGQILLTQATAGLVREQLPEAVSLRDLGEHHLKDLTLPEKVYQVLAPDIRSEFPPLRTLEARPNNLPLQPTALVGRTGEVQEVRDFLCRDDVWLLTLTGPGGIGKTRLALQVAAELLEEFDDGAYFVSLAPLVDHDLVVPTIAHALGLREGGGQPIAGTLKTYLRDKKVLLVLDNFEHVAEAAPAISALFIEAAGVKVLCTSRTPLRLRGEHEYPVPPLSVPDPKRLPATGELAQYEAVRLFIERAAAVKADFQVTNENAPAVAEICVRLDGLPLAIELAAARIRLFPPQALLARLSQRLKVLTGGAKDLPARQQTLRNTIDWSYDLLDAGEKQLFRRMAVLQGGATFEALEAVCNFDAGLQVDILDGVESLVLKSLLRQREGWGGEPRFWMLETIREYAHDQLQESGEAAELARRHALYFMHLAEEAEPGLMGARQQEVLSRLGEEHDNLRAALLWARGEEEAGAGTAQLEVGLRIGGALWRFWYIRGYLSEGREQLGAFLDQGLFDRVGVPGQHAADGAGLPAYRAKVVHGKGVLAWQQCDYPAARKLLEESLALHRSLGNTAGVASAVNNLGGIAHEQGDHDRARALFTESLELQKELGNKWATAGAYGNLGLVAHQQGDLDAARALQEQSLALSRELGEQRGTAIALNNLGLVLVDQGDLAAARSMFEESLGLRREIGDRLGIASSLNNLGLIAHQRENYEEARALYEESLAAQREVGDKRGIALSLIGWSAVAIALGMAEQGALVLGASEALLDALGAAMDTDDRLLHDSALSSGHAHLGEAAFEKLRQQGRGMSIDEAVDYALAAS